MTMNDQSKFITHELELCLFGTAANSEGDFTFADTMDEATIFDVQLHLRFEQTGQIEILYEKEFDNEADATLQFNVLETLFADVSQNIWPTERHPSFYPGNSSASCGDILIELHVEKVE